MPNYCADRRLITHPDPPETHNVNYFYYGAGHTLKDPGENILLAGKWVYAGKRVIVLFDGCTQFCSALSPLPPLPQ